jgi:hypothetical protein
MLNAIILLIGIGITICVMIYAVLCFLDFNAKKNSEDEKVRESSQYSIGKAVLVLIISLMMIAGLGLIAYKMFGKSVRSDRKMQMFRQKSYNELDGQNILARFPPPPIRDFYRNGYRNFEMPVRDDLSGLPMYRESRNEDTPDIYNLN